MFAPIERARMGCARKGLRIGLHGLLIAWMSAVAVAPLWHIGHAAPPAPTAAPAAHDHGPGTWMCSARPQIFDPTVDCVLCKAQHLLSQYWTRVPGAVTAPRAADVPLPLSLFVPGGGERVPIDARAPPLR